MSLLGDGYLVHVHDEAAVAAQLATDTINLAWNRLGVLPPALSGEATDAHHNTTPHHITPHHSAQTGSHHHPFLLANALAGP
jgi:hypothetical protein